MPPQTPRKPLTFVHICTDKPASKYVSGKFIDHQQKYKKSECYIFTSKCETDYGLDDENQKLKFHIYCGPEDGDLTQLFKPSEKEFIDKSKNDMYVVYRPVETDTLQNMDMICIRLLYALQSTDKTIYLETNETFVNHLDVGLKKEKEIFTFYTIDAEKQAKLASKMLEKYDPTPSTSDFLPVTKLQTGTIFTYVQSKAVEPNNLENEFKALFDGFNSPNVRRGRSFYKFVCDWYDNDHVINDSTQRWRAGKGQVYIVCENPNLIVHANANFIGQKKYNWPELQIKHAFAIEVLQNQTDKRICPKNVNNVYDIIRTGDKENNNETRKFAQKLWEDLSDNIFWFTDTLEFTPEANFDQFVALYELDNRKLLSIKYESYAGKKTLNSEDEDATNRKNIENRLIILDKHYFWSCHAAGVYMYRWLHGTYPTNEELMDLYSVCLKKSTEQHVSYVTTSLVQAINMLVSNNVDEYLQLRLSSLMTVYYWGEKDVYTSFDKENSVNGYVVSNYPFAIISASKTNWNSLLENSVHGNVYKSMQNVELAQIMRFYKLDFPQHGFQANTQYTRQSYLLDFTYNLNFESVLPIIPVKSVNFITTVQQRQGTKTIESMNDSFKQLLDVVVDKGLLSELELGFALALSQFSLLLDVCERKKLLSTKAIAEFRT